MEKVEQTLLENEFGYRPESKDAVAGRGGDDKRKAPPLHSGTHNHKIKTAQEMLIMQMKSTLPLHLVTRSSHLPPPPLSSS